MTATEIGHDYLAVLDDVEKHIVAVMRTAWLELNADDDLPVELELVRLALGKAGILLTAVLKEARATL